MDKCSGKVCQPGKICNPSSGRCVLRTGDIGKKLMKMSAGIPGIGIIAGGPVAGIAAGAIVACKKACTSQQVCNPKSKRCVDRSGVVGRKVIADSAPAVAGDALDLSEIKKIRHSYGEVFDRFVQGDRKEVVLTKKISVGSYGKIFIGCRSADKYDCRVIKIQHITKNITKEDIVHEIAMQEKLAKIHLAPRIYKTGLFVSKRKKYAVIEMERIDITLQTLLHTKQPPEILNFVINGVVDLVEALCAHEIVHGDFHTGNIAVQNILLPGDKHGLKLLLIDFGMSCCVTKDQECQPQLELLQFMRSFFTGNSEIIEKSNSEYLYDYFSRMCNSEFGMNLPGTLTQKTAEYIDKAHSKLWSHYIQNIHNRDF